MEQCGVLTFPIMHKYIDADDVFTKICNKKIVKYYFNSF